MSDTQDLADDVESGESLTEIVQAFAPLAERFIDAKAHELQIQQEAAKRQDAYQHAALQQRSVAQREWFAVSKSRFFAIYWAIVATMAFILFVAAGLIFYLKKIDAGMLLMSHLFTLATGLLAGIGIRRRVGAGDQET